MNVSSDAAEQIVRMSLEGMEVMLKISGQGAKLVAVRLAAALKEEEKTRGRSRITSMIKSGKPLKVYEIQQKDLKTFAYEARRYGVLYTVLRDKNGNSVFSAVTFFRHVRTPLLLPESLLPSLLPAAEPAAMIQRQPPRLILSFRFLFPLSLRK